MAKRHHLELDESTPEAPPRHRFRFGERWERRRQMRSIRKIWMLLALDLALLLIIVALTRMLIGRLW